MGPTPVMGAVNDLDMKGDNYRASNLGYTKCSK